MTDSAFIQELQAIQRTNYVSAAAGALVAYNQVLTFSQEVDHIWNRPWSFMTALYLIARYSGSLNIFGVAARNMYINWTYSGYLNMMLVGDWFENIFLATIQAILVIRVYALFNRYKHVLIFLATLYALQVIATFVLIALTYNNRALHEYFVSVGPAIGSVLQSVNTNPSAYVPFNRDVMFLPPIFDAIVLVFALWAFVRHALEAKTSDGGWSINVLMRTLVADHLAYFVCFQIWMTLTLAANYTTDESGLSTGVIDIFTALAVVAGPRMVISLRATENKTRGEGSSLEGEVSTIQFGIREPTTPSQSAW